MQYGGDWDGSNVHKDHVEFLRKTWRLPGADKVEVRLAPAKEITPEPREGERVVFRSHFLRDIGLPVSAFFRSWLEFYQLQPHHLPPNTVVLLSAFVTLCEGYLGVLPTLELWGEFFQSKLGTRMQGVPAQSGAFIAMRRVAADNPFPVITLIQSVKLWQKSYFYVRNVAPQGDYVNLPAYVAGPPAGRRPQWSYRAVTLTPAGNAAVARVRAMIQSEGLSGPDSLAAFVTRRVLPLQSRPHLICQMSGQLDPSRMCTKDMPHDEVAYMVNYLANCKLSAEWKFGKEPYCRANPPPTVCSPCLFFFSQFCRRVPFGRL
ncbi:hypothetical protein VPH35_038518 [Triticum aestivum]